MRKRFCSHEVTEISVKSLRVFFVGLARNYLRIALSVEIIKVLYCIAKEGILKQLGS